ncbi:MAG: thioesterase family protein, partial [Bdellovibrionota bacterium]
MASKIYHCTIEVRGYELDSLGHVNHAMYFSYLEHARWKMLEQEGITLSVFETWKRWPVVVGIEAHFLRPTYIS